MSGRREFARATKRKRTAMAGGRCEGQHCGTGDGPFHHDHHIPDWRGGDNSLENCRYLCVACHKVKSRKEEADKAKQDRLEGRVNAISGEPVKSQWAGTHRGKGKLQGRGFQGSKRFNGEIVWK